MAPREHLLSRIPLCWQVSDNRLCTPWIRIRVNTGADSLDNAHVPIYQFGDGGIGMDRAGSRACPRFWRYPACNASTIGCGAHAPVARREKKVCASTLSHLLSSIGHPPLRSFQRVLTQERTSRSHRRVREWRFSVFLRFASASQPIPNRSPMPTVRPPDISNQRLDP